MKLLLIGPLPPPISGVSLANKVVKEGLGNYSDITIEEIDTNYSVLKEDIGSFSVRKVTAYLRSYKGLAKVINCDKVYITPGQTFLGVMKYLPFYLLGSLFRKEIITHIHGNYVQQEYQNLKGIKKFLYKAILSRTSKGIVLSKSLKSNMKPFIAEEKIYVLENFVEDYVFGGPQKNNFNKPRIFYLSNLMKEKGIEDLLDALNLMIEEGFDFEAKIAGGIDSNMKDVLLNKLNSISDKVTYLGVVHGSEKKELLRWGNIFVFPTYYKMEGQPISILEAMSTGNVILTTEHAGIPDIFKEGLNGYYIEKHSPQSILKTIHEIWYNVVDLESIARSNVKEAEEKYRVGLFIDKLYKILKY